MAIALCSCNGCSSDSKEKVDLNKNYTRQELANMSADEIANLFISYSNGIIDAYKNDDINLAHEVEPLEAVIKKLVRKVKARHIDRLKEGACTNDVSFMFVDLLTVLRRIAAHCGNIAMTVIQYNDSSIGKHEYNHRNKDEDVEFISKYQDYKSRYSVSKS
jgi:phosphate:Na+ symporter